MYLMKVIRLKASNQFAQFRVITRCSCGMKKLKTIILAQGRGNRLRMLKYPLVNLKVKTEANSGRVDFIGKYLKIKNEGHLTQLLWERTSQMGTAFATGKLRVTSEHTVKETTVTFVVANYFRGGNVLGTYAANVMPYAKLFHCHFLKPGSVRNDWLIIMYVYACLTFKARKMRIRYECCHIVSHN